jgi:hypothetical protein
MRKERLKKPETRKPMFKVGDVVMTNSTSRFERLRGKIGKVVAVFNRRYEPYHEIEYRVLMKFPGEIPETSIYTYNENDLLPYLTPETNAVFGDIISNI